jgi:hypothetical protein
MPVQLPNLPQWIGPDENGWWGHPLANRFTWRLAYEAGDVPPCNPCKLPRWVWQFWAKKPGDWVARFWWFNGAWIPIMPSGLPSGQAIPPEIYPPVVPPELAAPPIAPVYMLQPPVLLRRSFGRGPRGRWHGRRW